MAKLFNEMAKSGWLEPSDFAVRESAHGTKQTYRGEFAHVRFRSETDMADPANQEKLRVNVFTCAFSCSHHRRSLNLKNFATADPSPGCPPRCYLVEGRTREVRRALARAVAKSALNTSKKSFRNFAQIRARWPYCRTSSIFGIQAVSTVTRSICGKDAPRSNALLRI
jgi:hypothetical protein